MKKVSTSFTSFLSFCALAALVGCGGSGGNSTPTTPAVNTPPTCAAGQVWNGQGCVIINGVIPSDQANSNVQFYDYNRYFVQGGFGYTTVSGDMTILDSGAYKAFLKEAMGLCDRNIWGIQSGLADCDKWTAGSFQLSFSMNSSMRPTVRFEAMPAPSFFQFALNLGIDAGGVAFNPLVLNQNNTFNLINNSKGFEIRAQGSYWNGGGLRLIQIQVHQGTISDSAVTYELYYPYNNVATKFATGKLKRY